MDIETSDAESVEVREQTQEGAPQAEKEPTPKPPWESDEDFQPERAWNLIQNLRAERDDWKKKYEPVAERLREIDEANLTAEQKVARELEEATGQAETLKSENALLKAALEHGLSADDLALLDGLPAEVIAERAEALSERLAVPKRGGHVLNDKPKPQLLRGSNEGAGPSEMSAEQIVEAALG